jgi:Protein of unknown function (DUF2971)
VLQELPLTPGLGMTAVSKDEARGLLRDYQRLDQRLPTITGPRAMLLAHYTSVQVIEQILRNNEIWLSNPLYMNDLEEMRAGVVLGAQLFPEYAQMAGNTPERSQMLVEAYNHYLAHLQTENAIDTYIFCTCTQPPGDNDGLLSMWREYGSKGNGAALVFNVQKVNFLPNHPLLISEVVYATAADREEQLRDHLRAWAQLTLDFNLADNQLYLAAYAAFLFVKLVALTTKHRGFHEEKEVRVIYYPERDPRGYLKPNFSYYVGSRGVEPKLKYKFGTTVKTTDGDPVEEFVVGNLADLIEFIILGPTASSPLAKASFIRMLRGIGMTAFAERVFPSAIPLRPTFQT